MRRRTASILVTAVVTVALPQSARAQLERTGAPPTRGVLLPGASLTLDANASALETNPAQAGWLGSWSLVLAHTELRGKARYLGTGTGLFFGGRIPLVPISLSLGAQLLRPADGFGERYPDMGKLSLGLAVQAGPWLTFGLGGHVFATPGSVVRSGLATLDAGFTARPTRWLSLAMVVRDLTSPSWDGLPLQRRWDFELGLRPILNGRLAFAFGIEVGERRQDLAPRFVIQGEPWPGFTLFADATWLRRDVNSTDDVTGVDQRRHDVRFTAGLRVDFERVGVSAAFVGGAPGLTGGATGGASVSIRISGDRYRSVTHHSKRVLLVDLGENADALHHWYRLAVLHSAARDRGIRAVLIKISAGLGWSGCEDVRRAIAAIRRAGKKVIVYLYATGAQGYYMAAAADKIMLFPGGGLRFAGLVSSRLYFKGTLDKLGIKAQIVRHAEYKSAPEAFTRTGPSPEAIQVRDALLDDFGARFYAALATRPMIRSAKHAQEVLAKGPFTSQEAVSLGLVDKLVFPDQAPEYVFGLLGRTYPFERPPKRSKRPNAWSVTPVVAVIAIEGDIVEGESRTLPLIGRRLAGARTLIKLLVAAAAAPQVKAVVLRVDTGGGSALASEALWRAVAQLAKDKPVIASFGNVAASGGYFAAASARQIFAEPSTITGSIGIFAGKADLSGLLTKLGVTVDLQRRGPRADVDSMYRPYTPAEEAVLKKKLQYYYHRFLDAVAKGRKTLGTRAQVEPLARGRVWSGAQARQRGLVDQLGGFYEAVNAARKAAGLRVGDGHRVVVLPRPRPGLISRALKLFFGGKARTLRTTSPLLQKLLAPVMHFPPSLLLSQPDAPQARIPMDITIR
ncbi:MAG: signal peptide peptidase SppA [bacterium]